MTSFPPDRSRARLDPGTEDLPTSVITTLNLMVAAMAGALVMLGLVLVLLGAELVTPDVWVLIVLGVVTAAAWGGAALLPVRRAPGTAPAHTLRATVMLRVALLEAPALLGVALALVGDPVSLLTYTLPAAFSLVGIWLFARPRAVLDRLNRAA